MQAHANEACQSRATLDGMVTALRADVERFDGGQPARAHPLSGPLDPLAIDYMVAGSRLGTKILHKTWAASAHPAVLRANSYFGQEIDATLWPQTCQALTSVNASSARADKVVADTRRLFKMFVTVFQDLGTDQEALV